MSQSQPPQQYLSDKSKLPPHYYQQPQNDEIDLRELLMLLWKGKWIIIVCTILCTALAIVYVLMAKEQWSSTAKIAEPQVSDYSEYQNQVVQFQPIFDVYQADGTILVSKALNELLEKKYLYRLFIDEFNSSNNKKVFLETSSVFQEDKAGLNDPKNEDALRKLYSKWYKMLSIESEDSNKVDGAYIISVSSKTSQYSFNMLKNYVDFVGKQVHRKVLSNLTATISAKNRELKQQSLMLTKQAKKSLLVEIERSEYALSIAQAAGVEKPLQNFGDRELFAINLGADALKEKVKALSKIKNLSVIEPRLEQINSKLEGIRQLNIDENIQFYPYRYLDLPEKKVFRDNPKRTLSILLGFIFGFFLGLVIVFIKFFLIKK